MIEGEMQNSFQSYHAGSKENWAKGLGRYRIMGKGADLRALMWSAG